MNQEEQMARLFQIFSVTSRIRILNLIRERALCVSALSRALNITPAAVSQHLRVLRDAGLVTAEKRGYFVHYKADAGRLNEMNKAVGQLLRVKKRRGKKSICGLPSKKNR